MAQWPPQYKGEPPVRTQFRFPKSLNDRMKEACEQRMLAPNYLVMRALEEYLDKLDKQA